MNKGVSKDLLKQVIQILERKKRLESNLSVEDYKIYYTQVILEKMSQSDDYWLSICPFNYYYMGKYLENILNYLLQDKWNSEILDNIFLTLIRFLREAELTMRRQYREKIWNDSDIYERIWDWFKSLKNDDITHNNISQLNYIQNDYSLMLLNDCLGNKSFQAFLNHEENIKKIEQQSITLKETSNKIQKNFDEEIQKSADEKLEKVEQLSDTLENLKQGFNFVALSDGFSRMLNEKKSSKKWILRLLFLIAGIISAIPAYIVN